MNFIDYREKLGIGFNDEEKFRYLKTTIFNIIFPKSALDDYLWISVENYFAFCNLTASPLDTKLLRDDLYSTSTHRFSQCVSIIEKHSRSFSEFLLYYISLANSLPAHDNNKCDRNFMKNLLKDQLNKSRIQFDLVEVDDEFFIFPKGAEELDKALVSEPLQWLSDYPKAQSTYCRALKQYANGEHIRDVADNFRKALEEFLQEYLGNKKNLEHNKNEICKYLGSKGVDAEFIGMMQPLLNTYKNINDKYAKHNDSLDERLLEFIMYQTGVFIRMIISVK